MFVFALGCQPPADVRATGAGSEATEASVGSSFEVVTTAGATSTGANVPATSTGARESDSSGDEPPEPAVPPLPRPGTFADVTEAAGIEAPHVPGGNITGQAWGDYDRDGDLDLFVTGGLGENRLLRNRGDGTFETVALPHHAAMPGPGKAGVTWADYDNDGWLDLYVTVLGPNVLLHNEQGRGWVAADAGVDDAQHGRSAAWGDYDGDGWLDLYLVNGGDDHDRLFNGEPGGTFSDRSERVALRLAKPGYAATWLDYDDDGDLDLYVVNDHLTGNDLWRNDGPGPDGWQLTNVSHLTGAGLAANAMGTAVGDYDRDGDLDVFSSDIHRTNLLRNETGQGGIGFTEVAARVGVDHGSINWGAAWIDVDLDGWQDLYLATQDPQPMALTNRLYRNLGGTFEDISDDCGCADPRFTTGVAAADYDGDGAIDLVIGNYGTGYRLLHNERVLDTGHHWLVVDLTGAPPINRDAIGAKVSVHTSDGQVHVAERRSGSSLGAGDMLPLHFGLGTATVDEIRVRWPNGTHTRHVEVPTDARWHATYGVGGVAP